MTSEATDARGSESVYPGPRLKLKCEDERAESRWKLWLCEKAILVWARLMEEMIKVGEIVGTGKSRN